MAQVERSSGLGKAEFYERYLGPRRPVILLDLADDWPARHKWTWDFFKAHCGESMMPLQRNAELSRSHNYEDGAKLEVELRGYVKYLCSSRPARPDDTRPYANGWHFDLDHPELLEDYRVPELFEDWIAEQPAAVSPHYRWIYMGPAGTGTGLHIDNMGTHAWLTQLIGRKQWVFFAPDAIPLEYCDHANAFNPDLDRFPAFRGAEPLEAVLSPGETMFVPAGWRHQVRNLDASLALTENFANMSNFAEHLVAIPPEHLLLRLATEELARIKVEDFIARLGQGQIEPFIANYEFNWMQSVLEALARAHAHRTQTVAALSTQLEALAPAKLHQQ